MLQVASKRQRKLSGENCSRELLEMSGHLGDVHAVLALQKLRQDYCWIPGAHAIYQDKREEKKGSGRRLGRRRGGGEE